MQTSPEEASPCKRLRKNADYKNTIDVRGKGFAEGEPRQPYQHRQRHSERHTTQKQQAAQSPSTRVRHVAFVPLRQDQ